MLFWLHKVKISTQPEQVGGELGSVVSVFSLGVFSGFENHEMLASFLCLHCLINQIEL